MRHRFTNAVLIAGGVFMMLSGFAASSAELDANYSRRATVREFVLFSYRNLSRDLLRGEGVYLANLHRLLNVDESRYSSLDAELKRLLLNTPRIPDFAVAAAELSN